MARCSIEYKILKDIGEISTTLKDKEDTGSHYEKRLVIERWGNHNPKIGIRHFKVDENGEKIPLKGIGLSSEEFESLKLLINVMDFSKALREG